MSAYDLARWAADAFARYDVAATHRIVTAATGPGPLPDWVSARTDPATGDVLLPRPVGVVVAAGDGLDEVVRRVLLTRNALLVDIADGDRVRLLGKRAEAAGAPAGVVQVLDGPAPAATVLSPPPAGPVVVIVDGAEPAGVTDPDAVVLTVGAGYRDLGQAVRAARGILRETGGDRVRVYAADPGAALRVAAALPVSRVASGDAELPPPGPDGLVTWTRIRGGAVGDQPWAAPAGPVPPYPRASNERP
jgi:hypothetical protein